MVVPSPLEVFETLRSLDRRLLAVEGDLETLIADELDPHTDADLGGPDPAEMSRFEIELCAVARELVAAVARHGIEVPVFADADPRRDHALTAYRTLAEQTALLRSEVRTAVAAFAARYPGVRAEPALDDGAPIEGTFFRRRPLQTLRLWTTIFIIACGLVLAAWSWL